MPASPNYCAYTERNGKRFTRQIWIGIIPKGLNDPRAVQMYAEKLAREMYFDPGMHIIEVHDHWYGGQMTRSVFAIRRPVEDVVKTL